MARTKPHLSRVRQIAAAATAAITTAALVSLPTTAHAQTSIDVSYPFTGTTHVGSVNADFPIGPGTISGTATPDVPNRVYNLTANLQTPPSNGSYKQWGVFPVTVTVTPIEEGTSTGTAEFITGALRSTSRITLRVSDLKVAGIPLPVGDGCTTTTPITLELASGDDWTLLGGGTLSGTYTIPDFQNCGLVTPLINIIVPGSGNTITLNLGPADLAPPDAEELAATSG
jgi:hypothetical protein